MKIFEKLFISQKCFLKVPLSFQQYSKLLHICATTSRVYPLSFPINRHCINVTIFDEVMSDDFLCVYRRRNSSWQTTFGFQYYNPAFLPIDETIDIKVILIGHNQLVNKLFFFQQIAERGLQNLTLLIICLFRCGDVQGTPS